MSPSREEVRAESRLVMSNILPGMIEDTAFAGVGRYLLLGLLCLEAVWRRKWEADVDDDCFM